MLIEIPKKIIGGTSDFEFTQLVEEIRNRDVKLVLLDLSNVEIINSTGLGLLVASYFSLKKNNILLILINVLEKVFKLLEITHLLQIFTIKKDLQDFLATKF